MQRLFALLAILVLTSAQAAIEKRVLIVGDIHTGNQTAHDSVSHAMATLERLGRENGAYIAFLRTDTQLVTKGEIWGTGDYAKGASKQSQGHNLDFFDAVVFYTNGEMEMTPDQKRDLLKFVHDDGKQEQYRRLRGALNGAVKDTSQKAKGPGIRAFCLKATCII